MTPYDQNTTQKERMQFYVSTNAVFMIKTLPFGFVIWFFLLLTFTHEVHTDDEKSKYGVLSFWVFIYF